MVRVFEVLSPYKYDIKEVEASGQQPGDYPHDWRLRKPSLGGSQADWDWADRENPYPNDEVMSAAAFLAYLKNVSTSQVFTQKIREVAYFEGSDRLVFK